MATANLPPLGQFPSQKNAASKPEAKKQVEKVTKGEAVIKEKRLSEKFVDAFVTKDLKSVKKHVIKEVIVPKIKEMFFDAVTDGLSMFLDMDVRKPSGKPYSSGGGYDYAKISSNYKYGASNNNRDDTPDSDSGVDYRNIVYATKEDANDVLSAMQDFAREYGQASTMDLFELAGISVNKLAFPQNNYGWKFDQIKHVPMRRIREGWLLDFPRPIVLD